MSNPFEDLASSATKHARKSIEREAKAPMVPTPVEKAVRERNEALRLYLQWKAQIRRGLSMGLYGPEIIMLLRLLRKVPNSQALVDWVKGSKWLLEASEDTRWEIMGYITNSMTRWNIRHGLPPFDDGLPGEPDGAFVQVRRLIMRI